MKQCIHCGKELPDEASFCPYCETEQIQPKPAELPKKWRKKTVTAFVAVCLLLLACLAGYALQKPKTIDNGSAEAVYKGYHLAVRFLGLEEGLVNGQGELDRTIPANTTRGLPARLFVFKDNDTVNAADEFMALVDHVTISAKPRENAKQMETDEPVFTESFPDAALAANVRFDTECDVNDIVWTITMANKDRIVLRQALTINEQQIISIYPQDAPMETIEELQALMDRMAEETDPTAVINLYLPAVIYDGGFTMNDRTFTLFGSSDGTVNTTFSGPVAIGTQQPAFCEIFGVNFAGPGSGTGLYATSGVICYDCIFSGWDTGAVARDGAWISGHNCIYENNGIGLQFNSHTSSLKAANFDGQQFRGNRIGLHLLAVPDDFALDMENCVFENNGTDIQNDCGVAVDLSKAEIR